MQELIRRIENYLTNVQSLPKMRLTDFIEILIIAFLLYHIMLWLKHTRAWALFKGLIVIGVFIVIAEIFHMSTILWIVRNVMGIAVIAIVIILQPELRKALEELGQKNILAAFITNSGRSHIEGLFSDHTLNEIVRASVEMAKIRTGALIVIEKDTTLRDYERTGIDVDAIVSSQLLINIFEKNTPLHDGAVIIRGDRVISATCYLPLSENRLDKDLGTRHRAGVGISEVTDSLTIIVSEETGNISTAYRGRLDRAVGQAKLKETLMHFQHHEMEGETGVSFFGMNRKDDPAKPNDQKGHDEGKKEAGSV
ncbi:MAG: diadenylate cyclase CdaA [Lachnospiraceae bacterium]|jgi:diadenylate cyclase|nr:diadenylate cyclase CdaA [Lachnospiraceae bacterium]